MNEGESRKGTGIVRWGSKKPPSHALVNPATSTGEGCNLGDVKWVLKNSTEVAVASDGCKQGSLRAPAHRHPSLCRALLPFMYSTN